MSNVDPRLAQHKVDPDPISIILGALGALGSLASIASYLEGRQYQKSNAEIAYFAPMPISFRNRTTSFKTKFRDRITKLDASLEDLKGRLETLKSLLEEVEFIGDVELSELPFEFGAVRPLLEKQDLTLFFRIQNEVSQLCTKITKDCQSLIKLLEELGTDVPPEVYSKLLQLRSRLNKAIGERQDFMAVLSLNLACIENGLEISSLIRKNFESEYE